MSKILKTIKYFILGVLFIAYISVIVFVSTLVLNRNDFGYTRFGNKDWLLIDENSASSDYEEGMLVIARNKKIHELTVGDKIFIYKTDAKTNTVTLAYDEIESIVDNDVTNYITLKSDKTSWGEEYIAGVGEKSYETIGKILLLLESKWIFFFTLVVPIFFILLYEIYLFIISIKYGDIEEFVEQTEEKGIKVEKEKNDEIEKLKNEIEMLKKRL